MKTRQIKDCVVVITGASSGIGAAAAIEFAKHGAQLVLAARNEAALEQVAAECQQLGARAIVVPTDVTDAEAMKRLARTAADRLGGRIDIWINNAGIGAIGEFLKTPIESHDQVIRTNLMGYLHGAHAVLPYFIKQQSGILINTNSLGGWVPAPFAVAYTASKFGLRGFSKALRAEMSPWPDIHICDVYPAFIDTPGLRHAANYAGKKIKPLPPLYGAKRVAEAMISLAQSPRQSVTVGQSANVARIGYALVPSLIERGMEKLVRRYLSRAKTVEKSDGNLFQAPSDEPQIEGGWRRKRGMTRPAVLGGLIAAGLVIGFLARR